MLAKPCNICGVEKAVSEFYLIRGRPASRCKACHVAKVRAYARANPDKVKANQRTQTLRRYGLTVESHAAMVAAQGGCCAICGKRSKLVVDHCHKTGKVRALTCNPCNSGMGQYFQDDPDLLEKAAAYLRHHALIHAIN